ncbi:putative D-alanyl-D-alanine carboxypeptidase [Actinoplanes missouriensis 431]|uniref:Putative D-alanyl-D-alanine carboxypeptidase n=1 Tax=Actinoplanes missouriensis (strain ATCC 14538 / DSM 43046 / CBS 188.64 / JCM 3121 / NBRC 102363 / NCIMB 12654 / NRRL B-3342 / UNCC 431) TaxID=512565 RepID=I0HF56_ACTM4|nr:putative D-alanyl-D-alanine carboxypeptidase [Actinoplanes missouriensis 431]
MKIIAALSAIVLLFTPVPAVAGSRAGIVPAVAGSRTGIVPAVAGSRAEIPCPKPKIAKPSAPPRPTPPPENAEQMAVGGADLATHGLVIPDGAKNPPALTATTWMVADLDTGEVLGACGPHVHQTPASVQKMLLAATAIADLDPKKQVTVTRGDLDIEPGSSAVGLVVGGKYQISTLWLGLLLNSGNDAANALARMAGGGGTDGVTKTVDAMNALAKSIGAYQTHAVTPSGLDGKGQFTSAYDLALIARVCFENADFRKYALTKVAQMPAQKSPKVGGFQFQNENKLIYNYPGAMGGKTGFTTVARHSYVGAAERGGRRLVATLLGAEARPQRGWEQGAALLDWGFSLPKGTSVGSLVTPEEIAESTKAPAADAPEPAIDETVPAAQQDAPRGLSVAAALTVAVMLAVAPLLLLLIQRRRRRLSRRF